MAYTSKTILPGYVSAKLNGLSLVKPPFKAVAEGEVFLVMQLETDPPEPNFTGFDRVYGKPELGKAEGQVGAVKANRFSFKNGQTPKGLTLDRDKDLSSFMEDLCSELGLSGWLNEAKVRCACVDELIETFDAERPFEGRFLYWNIDSRIYKDKKGYDRHDLFLGYPPGKNLKQFSTTESDVNPTAPKSTEPKKAAAKKSTTTPEPKKDSVIPPTTTTTTTQQSGTKGGGGGAMVPNTSFLDNKPTSTTTPAIASNSSGTVVVDDDDDLPFTLSNQAPVGNSSKPKQNNPPVTPPSEDIIFTVNDDDIPF